MTPSLSSVYEALVAFAASEPFADLVAQERARFTNRVGAFSPSDAWFEERSAALWDRVLTRPEVLTKIESMAPSTFGREHRAALVALARAQRGLFEVHAAPDGAVDVVCIVRGAAFRLAPGDDAARALVSGRGVDDDVAPGMIDARVVPTAEGVAILPGILVHRAEATESIASIIERSRERALADDDLFDALLSMRHRLASLSRMKARQVYRID